jgi:hypothetical protein
MSPEQLAERHTAAIKRHWRTLTDSGGKASPELLGELAGIAQEHAREVGEVQAEVKPAEPSPAATAPRTRAPARGRAK